jgi:hypothetical protein
VKPFAIDVAMPTDNLQKLSQRLRHIANRLQESQRERDAYLVAVRTVLAKMKSWCQPLVKAGVVTIRDTFVSIVDDDAGGYRAPAFRIIANGVPVFRIKPRGDGEGIDVLYGSRHQESYSTMLTMSEELGWQFHELHIYGTKRHCKIVPLTRDNFFTALNRLLDERDE